MKYNWRYFLYVLNQAFDIAQKGIQGLWEIS